MIELNRVGGSPESPPLDYAPKSPMLGWKIIDTCIYSERNTLDSPVVEFFDGCSTSPIRTHWIIMN